MHTMDGTQGCELVFEDTALVIVGFHGLEGLRIRMYIGECPTPYEGIYDLMWFDHKADGWRIQYWPVDEDGPDYEGNQLDSPLLERINRIEVIGR